MSHDDQPRPLPLPDLSPSELEEWLAAAGEPPYRARQIADWVFRHRARSTDEMTDLPVELRRLLAPEFTARSGREITRSVASDGTAKLLLAWPDGATTECVMIPGGDTRRTVCLSTLRQPLLCVVFRLIRQPGPGACRPLS